MREAQKPVSTRTVLQREMTECGAACLSMILGYYGQYATLDEMRMETDVSRDGCSAGNIIRAARKRGMECEGLEIDTDQLAEIAPPFILWWEDNHFVVFEGVSKKGFLLNDPAYGKRCLQSREMEESFSGIILTFRPTDEFRQHPSYGIKPDGFLTSGKIGRTIGSFRFNAWTTMVSGIAAVASVLAAALVLENIGADSGGSYRVTAPMAAAVFVFLIIAALCGGIYAHLTFIWEDRAEIRGAWRYLNTLLRAPIDYLEDRYPEDLVEKSRNNDRSNRMSCRFPARIAVALTAIVGSMVMMFLRDPRGAAPIILAAVFCAVLRFLIDRALVRDRAKATILKGNLIRTAFTDIDKNDMIQISGQGDEYARRLKDAHLASEKVQRKIRETDRAGKTIEILICAIGFILSLYFMGKGRPDTIVVFSWALLAGTFFVGESIAMEIMGEIKIVNSELDSGQLPTEHRKNEMGYSLSSSGDYQKLNGNLDLVKVGFGYGTFGRKLFEGLDLHIPGGSVLVVTGSTGCGKSTLGNMMGGLMMPSEGRILYDGRPIDRIPDRVICASIATARQKPRLFPATIRDNITMWNPNIREDEIRRALKDACAEEIIDVRPAGLDTKLGTEGSGLSGGEQQRIEIARALATDPSIMILDESFSGIDDETTMKIMDNIRRRGCTCILITRDPVLIGEENNILDLDDLKGNNDQA